MIVTIITIVIIISKAASSGCDKLFKHGPLPVVDKRNDDNDFDGGHQLTGS